MAADTEVLITAVVGAADEDGARDCCRALLGRVGGRVVECLDCSDEEPGCWAVTIRRSGSDTSAHPGALTRQVRTLLRELGPECARTRVSCEPPTAWAVLDDPGVVQGLVEGGERLLVEAWSGGAPLADGPAGTAEREPSAAPTAGGSGGTEEPAARLTLLVDVVTDRRSGAEWPARALASRLSRSAELLGSEAQPPVVRVALDLGSSPGDPAEVVAEAAALLGGSGWSRVRSRESAAVKRWSAAPAPSSGIAAIELSSEPDGAVAAGEPGAG